MPGNSAKAPRRGAVLEPGVLELFAEAADAMKASLQGSAKDLEDVLGSTKLKRAMASCSKRLSLHAYSAASTELKGALKNVLQTQVELRAAAITVAAEEALAAARPAGKGARETPQYERLTRVRDCLQTDGVSLGAPTAGGAIVRGHRAVDALREADAVRQQIETMACTAEVAGVRVLLQSGANAKALEDGEKALNLQSWGKQLTAEGYADCSAELRGAIEQLVHVQVELRAAVAGAAAEEALAAARPAGKGARETPQYERLDRVVQQMVWLEAVDVLRAPTAGGAIQRSKDGFLPPALLQAEAARLQLGGPRRTQPLADTDALERRWANYLEANHLEADSPYSNTAELPLDAEWATGAGDMLNLATMSMPLLHEYRGLKRADGIAGVELRFKQGDGVQSRPEFEAGCKALELRMKVCANEKTGHKKPKFAPRGALPDARAPLQVCLAANLL